MKSKLKVLVFVEHDIMIRNFIHSGAFNALMERHDVRFLFPEAGYKDNKRVSIDIHTLGLGDRAGYLTVAKDRMNLWAKLNHVNRLRWRPWAGTTDIRKMTRVAIGPGHRREYTFLALPLIFSWFQWRTLAKAAKIPNQELEKLLDEEQPDILIHPTVLYGVYISDLIEVSHRRKIPLVAITNSWDNAPRNVGLKWGPTWLLVWGEQAKRFAVRLGQLPSHRVINFGAAQFDVYREPPRLSRKEFCSQQEIEPGKTLLLYAGTSKETDEFAHLQLLDDAIEAGELGNTAILYRPHPWGAGGMDGGRIVGHSWKHVRIDHTMRAYLEKVRAEGYSMILPDYRDTRDILANVDATISPLSTMVLESPLNGKPSMLYMPDDEPGAFHFNLVKDQIHFQDIHRQPEFLVAYNRDQLVPMTRKLLERAHDEKFKARLPGVMKYFVEPFDEPFDARLAHFVENAVQAS
jgi:hypothetical protein